tara:strand:- start:82 stop:468 length:387 start_codon:yes stop_codon:yes gene_type:complete
VGRRHIQFELSGFLLTKSRYRIVEAGIIDMMQGRQPAGDEAPGHLVLTLGTGVKAVEASRKAVLDTLVVTGLEVQTVGQHLAAPVATVEGSGSLKAERGGHRAAFNKSLNKHKVFRHMTAKPLKKYLA